MLMEECLAFFLLERLQQVASLLWEPIHQQGCISPGEKTSYVLGHRCGDYQEQQIRDRLKLLCNFLVEDATLYYKACNLISIQMKCSQQFDFLA